MYINILRLFDRAAREAGEKVARWSDTGNNIFPVIAHYLRNASRLLSYIDCMPLLINRLSKSARLFTFFSQHAHRVNEQRGASPTWFYRLWLLNDAEGGVVIELRKFLLSSLPSLTPAHCIVSQSNSKSMGKERKEEEKKFLKENKTISILEIRL